MIRNGDVSLKTITMMLGSAICRQFGSCFGLFVCLMVFNATFNNISVISLRSVLLAEDPEKTTDLSHNVVHLVAVDFLTLQNKHNIRIWSFTLNLFALSAIQV